MSERSRLSRRTPSPAPAKTARRARPAAEPRPAPARTLRARPKADAAPEAGPIVKWVGGKTKLLSELIARAPATFRRYYEPFAGGAALFYRMAPVTAVLSDRNRDLIGTYKALATDVDGVIRRLEIHRRHHGEEHYYQVRARWNDPAVAWTTLDRAATFIYLNKTCYNGLWRVNRGGGFNVPMGRYTDPPICVPDALRASAAMLARADLRCGDFRAAVADAGAGDFVYFDPPYDPVSKTANFTSYTSDNFGDDHQRALADLARELVGRGCHVMLSNSDTPFVRSLYKDFRVDRVKCSRAINSDAAKRGEVDEVVILGGP
jgi:DNA adenine methylase